MRVQQQVLGAPHLCAGHIWGGQAGGAAGEQGCQQGCGDLLGGGLLLRPRRRSARAATADAGPSGHRRRAWGAARTATALCLQILQVAAGLAPARPLPAPRLAVDTFIAAMVTAGCVGQQLGRSACWGLLRDVDEHGLPAGVPSACARPGTRLSLPELEGAGSARLRRAGPQAARR